MQKELEGHIKYIIKTFIKKKVNALECCGYPENILTSYCLSQLFEKSQDLKVRLTLT